MPQTEDEWLTTIHRSYGRVVERKREKILSWCHPSIGQREAWHRMMDPWEAKETRMEKARTSIQTIEREVQYPAQPSKTRSATKKEGCCRPPPKRAVIHVFSKWTPEVWTTVNMNGVRSQAGNKLVTRVPRKQTSMSGLYLENEFKLPGCMEEQPCHDPWKSPLCHQDP